MAKIDNIKKLPVVSRTPVIEKLFNSTVEQLTSKQESDYFQSYIGRRPSATYDNTKDYYKPEINLGREAYQLEPTVSSITEPGGDTSNIRFYKEFVDYLESKGANVSNHERLFEIDEYSWCPPIDVDKFANYTWYYWLNDRYNQPAIVISGLTEVDVLGVVDPNDNSTWITEPLLVGQSNFTTEDGIEFKTGLIIQFAGTEEDLGSLYGKKFSVDGVGREIFLAEIRQDLLAVDRYEYAPWDENAVLINENPIEFAGTDLWDERPWDADEITLGKDYFTMERGSVDLNAWSRTNSWIHIDTLTYQQEIIQQQSDPTYNIFEFTDRAHLPIIEFMRNIELYNSGDKYIMDVDYVLSRDTMDLLSLNEGDTFVLKDTLYTVTANTLQNGEITIPGLLELDDVISGAQKYWHASNLIQLDQGADQGRNSVWKVTSKAFSGGLYYYTFERLLINASVDNEDGLGGYSEAAYNFKPGDIVLITKGEEATYRGHTLYWAFNDAGTVRPSVLREENTDVIIKSLQETQQKTSENQEPLFSLYDNTSGSARIEDDEDVLFSGSRLFGYKHNQFSNILNPELGIYLTYTGAGAVTDIQFEADIDNRPIYKNTNRESDRISGYYYYNVLADIKGGINTYSNFWWVTDSKAQYIVDYFTAGTAGRQQIFNLSVVPDPSDIQVEINGTFKEPSEFSVVNNQILIRDNLAINDNIIVYTRSEQIKAEFRKITMSNMHYPLSRDVHYEDTVAINIDNVTIPNDGTYYTISSGNVVTWIQWPTDIVAVADDSNMVVRYTTTQVLKSGRGYYEIPSSLEANYNNDTVTEPTFSDVLPQMLSILGRQDSSASSTFGARTDYTNSQRDITRGQLIRQNASNLVNMMLSTTDKKFDIFDSAEFACNEYTRYKNLYLRAVKEMSDTNRISELEYASLSSNSVITDRVFNEAVYKVINGSISNDAFTNSFMFAFGTGYEEHILNESSPDASLVTAYDSSNFQINTDKLNLSDYKDPQNALVIYERLLDSNDISTAGFYERVMVDGIDFEVAEDADGNVVLRVLTNSGKHRELVIRVYRDLSSANMPPTPSVMGMYPLYKPRIVVDDTIPNPSTPLNSLREFDEYVASDLAGRHYYILGHDGSKTASFGDVRDQMLLELEKRIYNKASATFKVNTALTADLNYMPPVSVFSVEPHELRRTEYQREEIADIMGRFFYAWSSRNNIQWRENRVYQGGNTWTYNLRRYKNKESYPSYWRGMYRYRFGTATPHLTPWECCGFADKPSDWDSVFGLDYSSNNTVMWDEIRGVTNSQLVNVPFKMNFDVPVDADGKLLSPVDLDFVSNISSASESDLKLDWRFGDGSPAEDAWRSSSAYPFHAVMMLALTKPARFSGLMFNTTESIVDQRNTSQVVNSTTGRRTRREDIRVHGETYDDELIINTGYQQWISDYIGRNRLLDIGEEFGAIFRNARVSLGHKVGGFTIPDNLTLRSRTRNIMADGAALSIPRENMSVQIHTSLPNTFRTYSGVLITVTSAGKFKVYGYDVETSKFKIFPKLSNAGMYELAEGGKEASYRIYEQGEKYAIGTIVRHNNAYWRSKLTHTSSTFNSNNWDRLGALPQINAVRAKVYPDRDLTVVEEVHYGQEFENKEAVVDFLIGYGEWLKSQGWKFETLDTNTSRLMDWVFASRQFLNWIATSWAPGTFVAISPASSSLEIEFEHGYPVPLTSSSRDKFILLNQEGFPIDIKSLDVFRQEKTIKVTSSNQALQMFFMRIAVNESEHVVILDNETLFGDIIFDSLHKLRQDRLIFDGFRSSNWTGKYEADGYFFHTENGTIGNLQTNASNIQSYYDNDRGIDIPNISKTARHMIGFESRDYLTSVGLSDSAQYQLYKGFIQEKGSDTSINKVLRITDNDPDEQIQIHEEWAVKLADFGASANTQAFDVEIPGSQVRNNPQVVLLDTPASDHGSVREIVIADKSEVYSKRPNVYVIPHPDDTGYIEWAAAYATLDDNNQIDYIDVIDGGSGYTKTPQIIIAEDYEPWDVGGWSDTTWAPDITPWYDDVLVPVMEGYSADDYEFDDIIIIDQDNVDLWHRRPQNTTLNDLWPVTEQTRFDSPTAGYVHPNDVDYTAFSERNLYTKNETNKVPKLHYDFNGDQDPILSTAWTVNKRDTVWMARNDNEDWNVYRVAPLLERVGIDFTVYNVDGQWKLETDVLFSDYDRMYQNSVVLFGRISERDPNLRIDSDSYEAYDFATVTTIVKVERDLTKSIGTSFKYVYNMYYDDEGTEIPENDMLPHEWDFGAWEDYLWDSETVLATEVWQLESVRYDNFDHLYELTEFNEYLEGELAWVDSYTDGKWAVLEYLGQREWGIYEVDTVVNNQPQTVSRVAQPLIDTTLIENAFVYDAKSKATVHRVPVYDPYKGIFPGAATQNIDWRVADDPAYYTNASDTNMIDYNLVFGENEVGKVWWDTSKCAYMLYEQGTLVERGTRWGAMFPESEVVVYEWVKSTTPPSDWDSDGTPKNETDYVMRGSFDHDSQRVVYDYYFWVTDRTVAPTTITKRTLSTMQIAQLLTNPTNQGYIWFSPTNRHVNAADRRYRLQELDITEENADGFIALDNNWADEIQVERWIGGNYVGDGHNWTPVFGGIQWDAPLEIGEQLRIRYKTSSYAVDGNSFVISNVNNVIKNRASVVQVNYKYSDETDQKHAQWELISTSDASVQLNERAWNKFVDSLVGSTAPIYWSDYKGGVYNLNTNPLAYDFTFDDVQLLSSSTSTSDTKSDKDKLNRFANTAQTVGAKGTAEKYEIVLDRFMYMFPATGTIWLEDESMSYQEKRRDKNGNTVLVVYDYARNSVAVTHNIGSVVELQDDIGEIYTLVPDPELSDDEKYGNMDRPRQSWFKDRFEARRVFVQVVNASIARYKIRSDYPVWNTMLASQEGSTWKWANWYADGYSASDISSPRMLSNLSEAYQISDLEDGQQVRIQSSVNDLYKIYVYDASLNIFNLIAMQNETIELLPLLYNTQHSHSFRDQLRIMLSVFDTEIWIGRDRVDRQSMLIQMFKYVLSEQDNVDWLFKTTYVTAHQNGAALTASRTIEPTSIETVDTYIQEIKPYHTKMRSLSSTNTLYDDAIFDAEDLPTSTISINVNNIWIDPQREISDILPIEETGAVTQTIDTDINAGKVYYIDAGENFEDSESGTEVDRTVETQVITWTSESSTTIPVLIALSGDPVIYVNNRHTEMFEYNSVSNNVIMHYALKVGDIIEIYAELMPDARLFANPTSRADMAEGIVPYLGYETINVTVEANPPVVIQQYYVGEENFSIDEVDSATTNAFIATKVPRYSTGEYTTSRWRVEAVADFFDGVDELAWDNYDSVTNTYVSGWGVEPWDSTASVDVQSGIVPTGSYLILATDNTANATNNYAYRYVMEETGTARLYTMQDAMSSTLRSELSATGQSIWMEDLVTWSEEDGLVWVGSELIRYMTKFDEDTGRSRLFSLRRGQNGTAIQDHPVGTRVQFVSEGSVTSPLTFKVGQDTEFEGSLDTFVKQTYGSTPITSKYPWNIPL